MNIIEGLPLKIYKGQPAAAGNNALIAAVPEKSIAVIALRVQATGTVAAKFVDTAGAPADLSEQWSLQAREGVAFSAPRGEYEFLTARGLGVQLNLSLAVACNVRLLYKEVG